MITIKNKVALAKMERAGAFLVEILKEVKAMIRPGVSTLEIDQLIEDFIKTNGLLSKTKGYMGYRHSSCISVNDEVVHGVPSAHKKLKDGDLVKVDICISWRGYCADTARGFYVGDAPAEIKRLMASSQEALDAGIAQARPGNKLSDISAAIQRSIEKNGFGVVRDFAGHGIGKKMHEDPEVLNYGEPNKGPVLRPGMTFAIEPMLTMGSHEVYVCDDGWTVKTIDKSLAMHLEDTIAITDGEPKILTRTVV